MAAERVPLLSAADGPMPAPASGFVGSSSSGGGGGGNSRSRRGRGVSSSSASSAHLPHITMSDRAHGGATRAATSSGTDGAPQVPDKMMEDWEFPGWGQCTMLEFKARSASGGGAAASAGMRERLAHSGSVNAGGGGDDGESNLVTIHDDIDDDDDGDGHVHEHKLGQLAATALCANDITSSCLYVVGLTSATAGKLAPVCLLVIVGVLYLFRGVYGEVVTALPMNGGCYSALLNTTSKAIASVAACLSLLSYVATAVVSGADACIYAKTLVTDLPLLPCTVALLCAIALLTWWGVKDSANVAMLIFIFHLTTLSLLIGCCAHYTIRIDGGELFKQNWAEPLPNIWSGTTLIAAGTASAAIFYGSGSAMLGVSGFETSANFVEEQAPGVFRKTLRNCWLCVSVLNPTIAMLALGVLPMDTIYAHSGDLLAVLGDKAGGHWLRVLVSVDATVVLTGAVLTSFVGVTGLIRRMSMDRVLPAALLRTNKVRGTNHVIIASFLAIATSLYLVLEGDVETLSGVYAISFLGVMGLFAMGCLLLKWKRPSLPRDERASPTAVFVALMLALLGMLSNVLRSPQVAQYFVLYASATASIVALMFQRTRLLRVMLYMSRSLIATVSAWQRRLAGAVTKTFIEIQAQPMVFFTASGSLPLLNKAVLYVRDNEQTQRLCIVHVSSEHDAKSKSIARRVKLLDGIYPKLRIDYVHVRTQRPFGAPVVRWVARSLGVTPNLMFIACPDSESAFKYHELGGVRVITKERLYMGNQPGSPLVVAETQTLMRPSGVARAASPLSVSGGAVDSLLVTSIADPGSALPEGDAHSVPALVLDEAEEFVSEEAKAAAEEALGDRTDAP